MFGNVLKGLRKARNLTQDQLAEIIGVERSSIGKYEGKTQVMPSTDVLVAIADYFEVSVDYLLEREFIKDDRADFTEAVAVLRELSSPDLRAVLLYARYIKDKFYDDM